jgi:hypothetical protein
LKVINEETQMPLWLSVLASLLVALLMSTGVAEASVHWNKSWTIVPSPNPNTINNHLFGVTAVSAHNVWAVGEYVISGEAFQTLIEHWNGSRWKIIPSPGIPSGISELFGVASLSARDIWAVGEYNKGGPSHTLIEHWDGRQWSIVPTVGGGPVGNLGMVAAVSARNVWAVGTGIEHWDGSAWSVVQSPNVNAAFNDLFGVAAISGRDIWAVGNSFAGLSSGRPTQTLIEHWNGTGWNITSSPNVPLNDNYLFGVTRVPHTDEAWSVGYYGPCCGGGKTLTLFHE